MTFGVLPGGTATADDEAAGERYLLFRAGSSWFAAHVSEVREIVNLPRVTEVPGAMEGVCGVALVRSAVVTVLDAARGLGERAQPDGARTRVLLVEHEGERLGLRVDEVARVERIDTARAELSHELPGTVCAAVMGMAREAAPGGGSAVIVSVGALVGSLFSPRREQT